MSGLVQLTSVHTNSARDAMEKLCTVPLGGGERRHGFVDAMLPDGARARTP